MANNKLRAQVVSQIKATDAQIDVFVADMERFLARSLLRLLKDLRSETVEATEAANILGQLFETLRENGLDAQLDRLTTVYGFELRQIQESLSLALGRGITFTAVDLEFAEALITFDIGKVTTTIQGLTDDARSIMMQQILLGKVPDIDPLLEDALPKVVSNVATELRTGTAAFHNTLHIKKARDVGVDRFVYLGPYDKVTREFCRDLLAKRSPPIYTFAEISSMDNGQGLDVFATGGGYNCRHQWRAVPSVEVEESLSA